MKKLVQYLRESVDELRKVKWPTRETTIQYSSIVLVSVVLFTAFFGGIDFLFTKLIDFVLQ